MSPVAEFLGREVARRTSGLTSEAQSLTRIASRLAEVTANGEHADTIAHFAVMLVQQANQFATWANELKGVQSVRTVVLASEPVEA